MSSTLSPISFLLHAAERHGGEEAVIDRGGRLDWTQFLAYAQRLAGRLSELGVADGSRVALLTPNGLVALTSHYAVPGIGAQLVALNIRLHPRELAWICRDAEVAAVVADEDHLNSIDGLDGVPKLSLPADPWTTAVPHEAELGTGPGRALRTPDDERTPLAINYTSGTTGRPKGAIYTHRGAYLQSLAVTAELGLGQESSLLWTLPMFHCNGWCLTWAVTAAGARHVLLRQVTDADIWRALREERVTHYAGAPTVHLRVVNSPLARPLAKSVCVATGGAPPTPTLLEAMDELNLSPLHLYGLTETYGPQTSNPIDARIASLPSDERARRAARQGKIFRAGEQLRVLDDAGSEVAADGEQLGEVVVLGETVVHSYHGGESARSEDGWFHTGDLAVRHSDGDIELRDRAKDIIVSGGENIATIEIEQVLAAHPAVLEAAIVAMADAEWGERPRAFVELKPGAQLDASELIAFCRERLAAFKRPATVEFVTLPRTATGKVQKYKLRERGASQVQHEASR